MRRSGRGGFRNNSQKQQKPHKTDSTHLEDDHPVLKAFRGYREELDDKHDRHERIVKLGRDITIESKRIIFLLHTIDGRLDNKQKIVEEAQQRLHKLVAVNFKAIAKELGDLDPYQFKYAYSPGLQEFIEAYTFMEFMMGEEATLSDWSSLQKKMIFVEQSVEKDDRNETILYETDKKPIDDLEEVELASMDESKTFVFFIDPTEYILGLSDLTGELMRRCINSLGSGETLTCMETCKALKHFYTGYVGLNAFRCRELSRKIYTMHQSVIKTENVCYNVKVRGGEAAKWGAVNAYDNKPGDDIDEGFY